MDMIIWWRQSDFIYIYIEREREIDIFMYIFLERHIIKDMIRVK